MYSATFQIKKLTAFALLLCAGSLLGQKADKVQTASYKKQPNDTLYVSGVVTDASSKTGAQGIRIAVKGFSATITDPTGNFKLRVPAYDALLQVDGEGYQSVNVSLKGRKTLAIALHDESHPSVYESIVLPYGTKLKSDAPEAATQFQADGSWGNPYEMPDAQLQGHVAGLNSIRRSGSPGVGANMFLRGYTSLYATNKPLVVIDNMVYDYNDYGESIIANNYTNPLALIDVKDIDQVSVLKDASSMYGTKGANGAIIITTARAKQQATKIDFGAYTGVNFAPQNLPVMNASDYRVYLSEMLQSKGMSSSDIASLPYMNDSKTPYYYSTHNNTDWQKKIFENSVNSNYYLKVTGGDNIATYALSMGYMKNSGVVKATDLTRYNTRFNAQFNFSQRFTGTANLSFTYNEQNLKDQGIANNTNPIYLSLVKAPFFTDRDVNENGTVSPNLADADALNVSNPAAVIDVMQAYNKYYRFFGSFGFKYEISKHVNAATLFGITYDKVRENVFIPRKGVANDTVPNAVIDSRLGAQVKRLFSIYNDTRLNYNNAWGKHHFNANLGMRYQGNQAEQDFALGFNSATDELVSVQNGVNLLRQVGGDIGEWNWMNVYVNADYNFGNRFFIGFNTAMDASSRFGEQTTSGIKIGSVPMAVMPSVSAAWLVSSEKFMANSRISYLKLRASYSFTGNDDIGNYSSKQTYASQNLLGLQGLVRSGISNPYLHWEKVARQNIGVDLGFWNDRVQLSADGWQNKTTNMLVYQPLETVTGFKQVITNDGSMNTKGLDLMLNVRVLNHRNLKWDISANASTYKNEVLSVPGGSFTTNFAGATMLTRNGDVANLFYGLKTEGVFSTDAEATSSGLQKKMPDGSLRAFAGGDVHFTDLNGDKLIDDKDRTVIGNPNPSWTGGINNRISWKRFTFDVMFTFTKGNDVYNYLRQQLESESGTQNQLQSVANRWRANGQVTSTPKATWGDPMGNAAFSDRWIEDGSYFRLRELNVAYNVPIKKQGFIKDLNIYASGYNLLTFTKYLGYDPEFSANPSVFAQGIDTGLNPQFISIMGGVKLGL